MDIFRSAPELPAAFHSKCGLGIVSERRRAQGETLNNCGATPERQSFGAVLLVEQLEIFVLEKFFLTPYLTLSAKGTQADLGA